MGASANSSQKKGGHSKVSVSILDHQKCDFNVHFVCFSTKMFLHFLAINKYRTRAIITRGLYLFYPIFHCGLYLRAVYIAERLVHESFFI